MIIEQEKCSLSREDCALNSMMEVGLEEILERKLNKTNIKSPIA